MQKMVIVVGGCKDRRASNNDYYRDHHRDTMDNNENGEE